MLSICDCCQIRITHLHFCSSNLIEQRERSFAIFLYNDTRHPKSSEVAKKAKSLEDHGGRARLFFLFQHKHSVVEQSTR
jgi:hypothetical protein